MIEPIEMLEKLALELNTELYEFFEKIDANIAETNLFEVVSNGFSQQVLFMDEAVWDSEYDDRYRPAGGEDEDEGDLESVEVYVRKKMDTFVAHLATFKFSKPL